MSSLAIRQREAAGGASVPSDVLGAVAHDLRQPLSNIETIAYYLSLVLPKHDPKIQEQLQRIRELVQETNEILANGLRLQGHAEAPDPLEGG